MTGYSQMPRIIANATDDIRCYLPTLYRLVTFGQAKTVVELGVRSGDSTRALLAGAMDIGGMVFSYDIAGDAYHVREVTERFGIQLDFARWFCCTSDSGDAASLYKDGSVDLLFVDTDHSLETTRREIALWHPKIAANGTIAFHDTELNEPNRDGVMPAISEHLDNHPDWMFANFAGDKGQGATGFGWITRRKLA